MRSLTSQAKRECRYAARRVGPAPLGWAAAAIAAAARSAVRCIWYPPNEPPNRTARTVLS